MYICSRDIKCTAHTIVGRSVRVQVGWLASCVYVFRRGGVRRFSTRAQVHPFGPELPETLVKDCFK